jgi:competence protein ComEC
MRPLIPLLLCFMTGITAGRLAPELVPAALAAAVASGARTLHLAAARRPARWAPLLLFFSLGCLSLAPRYLAPHAPGHITRFISDRPCRIAGCVASRPVRKDYRVKFVLSRIRLSEAASGKRPQPVKGRLKATVYGRPGQPLAVGDQLRFTGTIRPLHNFQNPGGFDYKSFMADQNVWGSTYASAEKVEIRAGPPPGPLAGFVLKKRRSTASLIQDAAEGEARAVLSTLVLGDRQLLSPSLEKAFNRAGASHILAISGLHVGIVAGFAFFACKHLLLFFPALRQRGWAGKGAAAMAILPVVSYGLLAGMSPSTQRAVIMVSVFLLSLLIERESDIVNTLAAAALAILVFAPPALFRVSFQLSFAAVLAIICGMASLRPRLPETLPGRSLLQPAADFMAVSAFAIAGTTPLILHYFNQAAFFGILTNILVIPLIGFLVVPAALFSVLVMAPLAAGPAVLGLCLAAGILEAVLPVLHWISGIPWAAAKTVTPSILELACIYILLFGGLFHRIRGGGNAAGPWHGPPSALALLLFLTAGLLAADIAYWCHDRYWNRDFSATVLDVGQGSAALVRLPAGGRILIDGGGFTSNAVFDVGENVVAPYLWDRKIASLDAVVLSHPDADHVNGLVYVLRHFSVKTVYSTQQPADSKGYREFIRVIEKKGIPHPDFSRLPKRLNVGGAALEILHPARKNASSWQGKDRNEHSLVIKAEYRGFSILFPGDITAPAEARLLAAGAQKLDSTVLVAPHHGSRTSSTPEFLKAVTPQAVIISAGIRNRFSLPSPSVLERYRSLGCAVFVTNRNGAVKVRLADGQIRLDPAAGNPVVLEPASSS